MEAQYMKEVNADESRSDRGIEKVEEAVRFWCDFIKRDSAVISTTEEDVQKWVDLGKMPRRLVKGVKNEPRAPRTRIVEFSRLHAFFAWVVAPKVRRHLLDMDMHVELPEDKTVPPPAPSLEDVAGILEAFKDVPELYDWALIMSQTGCRPEEVLAARAVDIESDKLGVLWNIQPWTDPRYCHYRKGHWEPKSKWSIRKIRLNAAVAAVFQRRVLAAG
jgi:integrase